MNIIAEVVGVTLLISYVSASNYNAYISELTNRNQRLHEDHLKQYPAIRDALDDFNTKQLDAIQSAPEYDDESEDEYDRDQYWKDVMNAIYKVRRYKNAEIPSQNNLWGEHKVSGGTGKGSQRYLGGGMLSKPEVKTDKLPAYCDPPNPCPYGMNPETASSPCDKNIPDTKTFNKNWIVSKMKKGECPCDGEHMQDCSKSYQTMNQRNLDKKSENPYTSGNERTGVVAKKAPSMPSDLRKMKLNERHNPFFEGSEHAVKKKDGRFDKRYM